jgi:uncharacterized protein YpmB
MGLIETLQSLLVAILAIVGVVAAICGYIAARANRREADAAAEDAAQAEFDLTGRPDQQTQGRGGPGPVIRAAIRRLFG